MKFRYRMTYAKLEGMRYTGTLDVHKSWERTFRRAKLPLAYSQGFHPQPKIQLACPLPLGFLSEHEILDMDLQQEMPVSDILELLQNKVPPGFQINTITQILADQPSLQVQTIAARYRIEFLDDVDYPELEDACQQLLQKSNILRTRRGKQYDLRPLILNMEIHQNNQKPVLEVELSALEGATGRPEEVLSELGIPVQISRITREETVLNAPSLTAT